MNPALLILYILIIAGNTIGITFALASFWVEWRTNRTISKLTSRGTGFFTEHAETPAASPPRENRGVG